MTLRPRVPRCSARSARAPVWAWVVCWLMFASTVLNYMDRQTIALVGPQIKEEFHLRNVDFGWSSPAAFSLTYALFQVPAGYLVDRWNVRWAYAGAVTWWSLAAMAAAYSPTLGALVAFRALLGVGESFNWPCALRVTRTILPPSDRSLGNGIFNSGAAIGAVMTPLVVMPLALNFGWRRPFLYVGSLGLVWVGVWLAYLGGSRKHILAGRRKAAPTPELPAPGLSALARGAAWRAPRRDDRGRMSGNLDRPLGNLAGDRLADDRHPRAGPAACRPTPSKAPTGPRAWVRSSGCGGSGCSFWSRSRSTSAGISW